MWNGRGGGQEAGILGSTEGEQLGNGTESRLYVLFSGSVVGGLWEKLQEGQKAAEGTGFSGESGFLLMH